MKITNQCKDYFITWYKEFEPKSDWRWPAMDYFNNHDLEYKISVLTAFFDSCEIFIKITPYLGGGQPVFFGSVCFRNRNNIDCETELNPHNEEQFYCMDRTETSVFCTELCNDIFNEINDPVVIENVKDDLDDLPF